MNQVNYSIKQTHKNSIDLLKFCVQQYLQDRKYFRWRAQQLKTVNCCCKVLHLRYFQVSLLQLCEHFCKDYDYAFPGNI